MRTEKYGQYTSKWTNILSEEYKPFSGEAIDWLRTHESKGRYHLHRSGTAVKFELKEDAEWFILRFL
jgi:hypothetical protein